MSASKFTPEIVGYARAARDAFKSGFVSADLAQWALESNYGEAEPAGSNNPFGIKAVAGQDYVITETHETINSKYVELPQKFAKYASIADSFMAHKKLLATSKYYVKAQAAKNVEDYCNALTGIYATGIPGHPYGEALIKIIDAYGLKQFDAPPVAVAAPAAQMTSAAKLARLPVFKQLLVYLLEAVVQTLEDDGAATHTFAVNPPAAMAGQALLGFSPMSDENASNDPAPLAILSTASAAPSASPQLAPAAPAVIPSVSSSVSVDWGDFAEQLLANAEPIVALAAPGVTALALHMVPAGSILSAFIGPKVVSQYVEQGMKTLEGVVAGKKLTIEHTGALETFVVNAFNNFEGRLSSFLGANLGPMISAEVAKVLPPA